MVVTLPTCDPIRNCNGHGTCSVDDLCICSDQYLPTSVTTGCFGKVPELFLTPTRGTNKGGYDVRVLFTGLTGTVASRVEDIVVKLSTSSRPLRKFDLIRSNQGIAGALWSILLLHHNPCFIGIVFANPETTFVGSMHLTVKFGLLGSTAHSNGTFHVEDSSKQHCLASTVLPTSLVPNLQNLHTAVLSSSTRPSFVYPLLRQC